MSARPDYCRKPYCHPNTKVGSTPLGDRLKQERLRRGFTINDFAAACGCGPSQITGMENRGVIPNLMTIVAMAQALHCSLDWLVGIES